MRLYLKIIFSHKILFCLLLCGLGIFFFSFEMFLYKLVIELFHDSLLIVLKEVFFYFLIVIVLCFNVYLILDKMILVCKPQFDVLLLCGFLLEDIIKNFMIIMSLCGMAGGTIPAILFSYVMSGSVGLKILLPGITYFVFLLLCFAEYIVVYRTLSGRFNNV